MAANEDEAVPGKARQGGHEAKAGERQARLAAALRQNLKRRKAQTAARRAQGDEPVAEE